MRRLLATWTVIALGACVGEVVPINGGSGDAAADDATVAADTGVRPDAGHALDADPVDSEAWPDAAPADSGAWPDADPVDSGVWPDADPIDSGVWPDVDPIDSGVGMDALGWDATALDASSIDTGVYTPNCAPEETVSTLAELTAYTPMSWPWPIITPDLLATATVAVRAMDFPTPTNCVPPNCSGPFISGQTASIAYSGAGLTRTATIFAGAAFRIVFQKVHRGPSEHAEVVFERQCRAPCAAGERRCPTDDICYSDDNRFASGSLYCTVCQSGAPAGFCSCVGWADGTPCEYTVGDAVFTGRCTNAICR